MLDLLFEWLTKYYLVASYRIVWAGSPQHIWNLLLAINYYKTVNTTVTCFPLSHALWGMHAQTGTHAHMHWEICTHWRTCTHSHLVVVEGIQTHCSDHDQSGTVAVDKQMLAASFSHFKVAVVLQLASYRSKHASVCMLRGLTFAQYSLHEASHS